MFYREMHDNEDMLASQQMPKNKTESEQQPQMEPEWAPFIRYPMMSGMYNPTTYSTHKDTYQGMERAPYGSHNSYDHGYHYGNDHDYDYDYDYDYNYGNNHGYNQGYNYFQNYNPYYNNYLYNPFFPLFFGRY